MKSGTSAQKHPWNALCQWGELELPIEAQEALLALLLEPHSELIDDLGRSDGHRRRGCYQG